MKFGLLFLEIRDIQADKHATSDENIHSAIISHAVNTANYTVHVAKFLFFSEITDLPSEIFELLLSDK